jgi:AraC-like DNA-binding protein
MEARLFVALEMLAYRKSVTEVAVTGGYDSVSAFIEMFRTMLGTTPHRRTFDDLRDHTVGHGCSAGAFVYLPYGSGAIQQHSDS